MKTFINSVLFVALIIICDFRINDWHYWAVLILAIAIYISGASGRK